MRIGLGLALDAALICLFAAIGRRNHGQSSALLAVASTAWPFLIGMTAGWLLALYALRADPVRLRGGIPVWLSTVAIGMVLRALTGSGTAFSFVVVAALFLGAVLMGWRAVASHIAGARS